MKPIEETETRTIYKCANCGKNHGADQKGAEQCCACCACNGPTTTEDKKFARGGSLSGFYRRELMCAWCIARKDVKAQQDRVRRQEADVARAKNRLAHEERELEKDKYALELLIAKRGALPPKREKKSDTKGDAAREMRAKMPTIPPTAEIKVDEKGTITEITITKEGK